MAHTLQTMRSIAKHSTASLKQKMIYLTQLNKALGHLSRILESIKSHRDIRAADRDACRTPLSPIRRIPNAFWKKILPSAMQVCRHWTQFLGSIPIEFDRIQLDLTDPDVDRTLYAQLLRRYSARLHGSVVLQLDIFFPASWKYCVLQLDSDAYDGFIERLTSHLEYIASSSWWQSITHLRIFNHSPSEWDRVFQRNTNLHAWSISQSRFH